MDPGREEVLKQLQYFHFQWPQAAALCMLRNLSILTAFKTNKKGTESSGLTVSHQEQQKLPLRGNQIFVYSEDRREHNGDFYGHTQKLSGSLFPEGAI